MSERIIEVLGMSYLACWSFSFYPQVFSCLRKKSTKGISRLFLSLNLIGFYSYCLYTFKSQWLVTPSDKIFAVHSLILSFILYSISVVYRDITLRQLLLTTSCLILLNILGTVRLGYIKLFITTAKYCPQIHKNYKSQSTKGFSTKGILLDLLGSIFSLSQLLLQGTALGFSLAQILQANSTKFGISLISMFMDVVLIIQYFAYDCWDTEPLLPTRQ
eukprot:NODE_297_length_10490_cov_1.102974.p6 type:complete len:217 gc:universal NODE_297_length_10490_cov_1.102974:6954-7604(+)